MLGFALRHVALCAGLALAGEAAAGTLDDLMSALAEVKERHARFVEERTLGVLDRPLITEGTFAYEAPDRLIRQDLSPTAALYALDGDRLDIVIDGAERTLSLDQEPMLRALVAPFRAIFAGDLETLKGSFDLDYIEGSSGWTLTLRPKADARANEFLEVMAISGVGQRVERIETEEPDGDLSVMRLEPLASPAGADG